MSQDPVVIVAAKRTPVGAFQGMLSSFSASQLGSAALRGALADVPLSVDEVLMGCVLSAGQGQAPARQATLGAGLPQSTPTLTLNKMCGSGLKAVMMACDMLKTGAAQALLAGGMESMTQAPYLLAKARGGYRMGHDKVYDHMMLDGLEDAYARGQAMGVFAEATAEKYGFTREAQDVFAISSAEKALKAQHKGDFVQEIVALTAKDGTALTQDEPPLKIKLDKIPALKPVFKEGGTVTAANSSSISDGAAAVFLTTESVAKKAGLPILAHVRSYASYAHAPEWFTTAPVGAMEKALKGAGWTSQEVDFFEINEAFAVVTMAAIKDLSLDPAKVNVRGGACALGHPIGASGARLLVTLLHTLQHHNARKGLVSLCIGGGEAVAMTVERC